VDVREIERSDIGDILALIRAKAEFDGCLESLQSKEEQIEDAFFSDNPKAKAIVASIDNEVVGIATFYGIYSTFIAKPGIWLDDLYVYEQYRKDGIGKALLSKLCSIAKETGCGRIDWIVARDNKNGRGFYDSIGATIFEEVRHSRLDESTINKLASNA
jgi:GNAT superfamily N-acetyltransferase